MRRILAALIVFAPMVLPIAKGEISDDECGRLPWFGASANPLRDIDLRFVLGPEAMKPAPGLYRLSPEWVGTLRETASLADWKREPGLPEPFRFNFLVVDSDGGCAVVAALTDKGAMRWTNSGYSQVAPVTTQAILGLRGFADFERALGSEKIRFRRLVCGTSRLNNLREKRHWTSRAVFCVNPDGTLTLRVVTAQFRLKSSDENVPLKENATTAESMFVREGVFTPAKPDSPEELRLFPSEDEKESRIRARLMAELERQPEPLRAFLRAKMAGEEPFRIALEKAKSSPDPELFRQMMARTRDFFDVVVAIKDMSPIGDWRPEPQFHVNQIRIGWHEFLPFSGVEPATPPSAERLKLLRAIVMALPESPVEEDAFAMGMTLPPDFDGKPRFMPSKARAAASLIERILDRAGITEFSVKTASLEYFYRRDGNSYTSSGLSHLPGDEKRALTVLRDRLLEEIGKKEKALRAGGS